MKLFKLYFFKKINSRGKIGIRLFYFLIIRLLFISVLGLFFLSSCRTLYKKRVDLVDLKLYSSGFFSGFVVLQQREKNYYLTVDIAISPKGLMKVDFLASMGIPVMSLLLDSISDDGLIIFFQSKSFYRGKKLKSILNQKFAIPLDLKILRKILFEKLPMNQKWKCQKNDALWKRCVYEDHIIEWKKKARQKILMFSTSDWKFSFYYSKFISKTHPNQFLLTPPSDFQLILVP